MVKLTSEQSVIQILKRKESRLSTCLSENGCMVNGCPKGHNPIRCFNRLETIRNSIVQVNQSIVPAGSKAWSGEYSVRSANNPKR
jgi:hypothetical protein